MCAGLVYICTLFGFCGLYATFVCIGCSQLEKLRANLLDIGQRHNTAQQDSRANSDQEERQEFSLQQEQLSDCIRHHQEILRCMLFWCIYHQVLAILIFMRITKIKDTDVNYYCFRTFDHLLTTHVKNSVPIFSYSVDISLKHTQTPPMELWT
jgi:hypothetical protein